MIKAASSNPDTTEFYWFSGDLHEWQPNVRTIYDEGYDEFLRITMGLNDGRQPFEYKITLRRIVNPKVKLCDVIWHGDYTIISGRVRRVIEEFEKNAIFYPAQMRYENGEWIDAEYYYLWTDQCPGGEIVNPPNWYPGLSISRSWTAFAARQVLGRHLFRSIIDPGKFIISRVLCERLLAEKFKRIELDTCTIRDIDWDPDTNLSGLMRRIEQDQALQKRWVRRFRSWAELHKPEWQ